MSKEKKYNYFYYLILVTMLNLMLLINLKAEVTYNGTVTPIFKAKIYAGTEADYYGYLNFAGNFGEITTPEITNLKGKAVEKGTLLSNMRNQYWYGQVLTAEGKLLATKKDLRTAYNNLIRYQKLYPTGAAPVRKFQETRATYFEKLSAYKEAEAKLIEQTRVLEECRQYAQIEGIVDKVYYSRGLLVSDPNVVDLTQLNPIGIKVEMPSNVANKINITTPVTIITKDSKNLGIYNGYSILTEGGIIFPTKNTPKLNTDKKIPRIRECFPVINFRIRKTKDNKLGVPLPALFKNKEGYYVWKAKNRKMMQPGKGFDPVFQVEKVRVVPGKYMRLYNGITFMRILDDPGSIELYDVVIASDDQLKNGDTVSFPPERYNLMPGDKVKVVIGIDTNETEEKECSNNKETVPKHKNNTNKQKFTTHHSHH